MKVIEYMQKVLLDFPDRETIIDKNFIGYKDNYYKMAFKKLKDKGYIIVESISIKYYKITKTNKILKGLSF